MIVDVEVAASFALAGMVVNERWLWHLVSSLWLVVKVPGKVGKVGERVREIDAVVVTIESLQWHWLPAMQAVVICPCSGTGCQRKSRSLSCNALAAQKVILVVVIAVVQVAVQGGRHRCCRLSLH